MEKGADYFAQNFKEIEKSRHVSGIWKRNTLIIEAGEKVKLSEFLRNVAELGYVKVWEAERRGEFSQRGGVVHIFPINFNELYAIEFEGNYIAEIIIASHSSTLGVESSKTPSVFPRGAIFHSGDYVVHIDHGIGIFRGEKENDFIIEYAAPRRKQSIQAGKPKSFFGKPDLLFVPKMQIKRLSPYLGFKKPEIHRLGTQIWSITKKKAKEDIIAFAKILLETLAKRKISERIPYAAYRESEEEFIASFPFEYTADQKKSIAEIFRDMERTEPMERILTGDVGFGKTEIAILAAFRAVLNGKQIAVLAPTTILADQHFEVFKSRLSNFGVNVFRLTRLESDKEAKEIFKKCENGLADIIIGTHKILSKHIKFKNIGFLIIDEEQKFGVVHKEHFKNLNPALDTLTLSATPIPRTLNIALSGIQPISTIESPPEGKVEVKTYVLPKNKKTMKEAIKFELARHGQIYFLANRIHKIPALIEELKSLKIGAKMEILHGRMPDERIVKVMHEFREAKIDILVSTTIIENGLDLSNVNTLIVEDSTKLGLSQAHQLRGRIGRGTREAYAYFLYPTKHLKEKAAERLEALERYSWMGAGLEIAKRDLEIRGAGNILGRAQSGIAYRIGLNLYFELLEEAIEKLKGTGHV